MPRLGVLLMQPANGPHYSYVNVPVMRWLKSSGLELVFIPSTISAAEAAAYFEYIHGLFLHPGWGADPTYLSLTHAFIRMATEANLAGDYFPIWGTCMGMQMLMTSAGGTLEKMHARDFNVRTELRIRRPASRLLAAAPIHYLEHSYEPHFNNEYGITVARFMRSPLRSVFHILGTSVDRKGVEYVTMIEGKRLPFYGVQFHPEYTMPHMNWILEFMATEMRRSMHHGFRPGPPVKLSLSRGPYASKDAYYKLNTLQ
jgi:gamma-glutamyl hydrolase